MIDMGILRGIATVLALVAFTAVTLWAFSARRRDSFGRAAQLPLEEDQDTGGRS